MSKDLPYGGYENLSAEECRAAETALSGSPEARDVFFLWIEKSMARTTSFKWILNTLLKFMIAMIIIQWRLNSWTLHLNCYQKRITVF